MRLGPRLVSRLDRVAREYRDDRFLAIRHDNEVFVTNWVLGLRFPMRGLSNSRALQELEERTDEVSRSSEQHRDIFYHIHRRGWMDILVGTGIYQDVELMRNKPNEKAAFEEKGWSFMSFAAGNGRRYYIRAGYFDIAEDVVGDDLVPVIFRPVNAKSYPHDYRPMLFLDGVGDVRGLVYAITEENLRNPIDREKEYQAYVEATMPELANG